MNHTEVMTEAPSPSPRPRVFYVDVIRFYASFLVIASHVFAPICAAMNTTRLFDWETFNLFDALIRPAAALFIMISGKLLLGSTREESYWRTVGRRCKRLLLPFFTWSMIYAAYEASLQGATFSFSHAIRQFIQGPTEYHLWFMYVILGFYVMAPFVRRFVQNARADEPVLLLALWFVYISVRTFAPRYAPAGIGTGCLDYGGYFVLGFVLDRVPNDKIRPLPLLGVVLLMMGINAAGTHWLTFQRGGVLDERLYWGAAPGVAIQTAATFLLLKRLGAARVFARQDGLKRGIQLWSRESYNLYLIHAFFLLLFTNGQLGFTLSETTGGTPFIGVGVTTLGVIGASFGLVFLARRIPIVSQALVLSLP